MDPPAQGAGTEHGAEPVDIERLAFAGSFRRSRLLRGGAAVMGGSIVQKAVNLAFIVVFARTLSRGDFDAFAYAVAFGVFFETFSDFGLDFVLARELNQRPESDHGRIVGTAMATKAVVFSATFAVAFAVSFVKDDFRVAALLVTLGLFCGIPGTVSLALRSRMNTLGPEVITTLSTVLSSVALIVAATRGASVVALATTAVSVRIGTSLVAYPILRRRLHYRFSVDRATARSLLRAALPVALSTFAVVVYARSDQIVLGVVGDPGELSGYAVAVRVVEAINFIPIAIGAIALPTFSHLEGFDEARLRRIAERAVRYVALVILPLAVLATVAGGPLLRVLFGDRFGQEGAALAVLLWAHFFASCWVLARPILIARRREAYLSLLAIIAAVVNVGLNLWLIPRYGGVGAAWASLLAYASPFAAAVFLAPVRDSFARPLRAAFRPAVAAAALLGTLAWLPSDLVVKLGAFAVLAPVLLLLTRSIGVREVRDLATSFVRGR